MYIFWVANDIWFRITSPSTIVPSALDSKPLRAFSPVMAGVRLMKIKIILFGLLLVFSHLTLGEKVNLQNSPRYSENPIYIFFEGYIQDVIGYLPKEKSDSFQNMNLQSVFNIN